MTILALHCIDKKYSEAEQYAVKDVSFEVNQGEILSLVGESGSGKTTLLRLIAGLEHPDAGHIKLGGQIIVEGKKSVPANKRNVGMVFQDYALFPHLSILDNVKFGLKGKENNPEKKAKETLHLVGLIENYQKYPHQLSGGQQQRVALARAIAPSPSILLMDEPFSNLDAMLKDQVREEVRQIIKTTGVTAIFVTHDTRDALSTSDRIAILHKGYLQQIDTPKALYEKPSNGYVANFFGRRNEVLATPTNDGFYSNFGFIPDERSKNFSGKVKLLFRPEQAQAKKNPLQPMSGRLVKRVYFGDHQLLHICDDEGKFIYVRANPYKEFTEQERVFFTVKKFGVEEAF
ncbi:ABC transporter ATP-binding protein [Pleomorphovibrio marinus]|uniref:ABC transporter ATP-binding protein n=1 Tax=Pleomorphovibrio marinus TaxID=2164132 RepID=UPI000E0A0BBF|nr:ABC transporter ATP-binding protein [Pleomorphovibrio marinus]